jgi:hypothetical protein
MSADLLKDIKHTLVDLTLDSAGSYKILLPHVEKELGRTINYKSFSMAMSGHRYSAAYQEILTALQRVLATWADHAA